ncbi:MAG: glycoside hydrolase family 15 protein [Fimbriimonadaceae bacterium]|nr:glycoside hydrolase family 15 protein [Fimbriimonadaceae bacterium]
MPRPLVFSNGRFFVGVDAAYRIRELTFPKVGRFDHARDARIRTGVWADGTLVWCDADGWERAFRYEQDGLVGCVHLAHRGLGVAIETREAVAGEEDLYARTMTVRNLRDTERDIRVFVTEDLNLRETNVGDTVLWDERLGGVIHFKERIALAIILTSDGSVPMYACGEGGFGDRQGTYRDAEDGELSGHAIAQGAVDATIGVGMRLGPGESRIASLVIQAIEGPDWPAALRGERFADAEGLIARRLASDREWLGVLRVPETGVPGFDGLVRRSLLLIRAFCDRDGGILAAYDNDILDTARAHYGYVWPRDGALVAMVLDEVGAHPESRAFFEFCARLPRSPRGGFWQKYGVDGTLGATWHPWGVGPDAPDPVQPDESALVLLALRSHLGLQPDPAFRAEVGESLVRPLARFLLSHRETDGSPAPGYDLWEERRGVHAFTVATTIAALRTVAVLLDDAPLAAECEDAAHAIERGWAHRFGEGRVPMRSEGDPTPDASLLMLASLGLRPESLGEERAGVLREALWVPGIGGMARYPGDYYFRRTEEAPGNPWVITTLWLAQSYLRFGLRDRAIGLLEWVVARAGETGGLAEQFDARTGMPLSVGPLVWSHAEVVRTAALWRTR